jgi:PAS domain S-box-containing protein
MYSSSALFSEALDPAIVALLDELPMAYVELNAEGMIVFANRAARALQPASHGDLVGKYPWQQMPSDEQERSRSDFFRCMQSGEDPPVIRRSLYTTVGAFRTHEVHRSLVRDPDGKPTGMRAVTMDVTEAHLAQEEARNAQLWLESILDSLAEAVIVTDALGFIRNVNPAAEEFFGWPAGELSGQLIEKRIPMLAFRTRSGKTLSFHMALDGPCLGDGTILDRARDIIQVEITASPIIDKENGCTMGVVSIWRKMKLAA